MEDGDRQDLAVRDLDSYIGSNGTSMPRACVTDAASQGLPTSVEPESWRWSPRIQFVKSSLGDSRENPEWLAV